MGRSNARETEDQPHQKSEVTTAVTKIVNNLCFMACLSPNDERSHAGPLALDCDRDEVPALADGIG